MLLSARGVLRTKLGAGAVFLAVTAIVVTTLAFKAPILTKLRSGETITAEFSSSYRLRPNESKVKLAGLKVGVVSSVEYSDNGTAMVSMKVEDQAMKVLGSEPSAVIAPLTILGGVYSVELRPGGGDGRFTGDSIPIARTSVPVELDRILETLPGNTRRSTQRLLKNVDVAMQAGGRSSLRGLVDQAPATMRPAGKAFSGLRGTRPADDLSAIVANMYTASDALSKNPGQLERIVSSLAKTSEVLADGSGSLVEGIESLPSTLRASRTGLADLQTTLEKLQTTSAAFRPSARELSPLLKKTNPVLRKARPLMADLEPLMVDARPLMEQLVPVTQRGTFVLDQVRGPVIDRVNGPVTDTVMSTWRGKGPYEGNGAGPQADHKFYEELGYLVVNMDRASMTQDNQGSMLGFQVGAGLPSVAGLPFDLNNLLNLAALYSGGSR